MAECAVLVSLSHAMKENVQSSITPITFDYS